MKIKKEKYFRHDGTGINNNNVYSSDPRNYVRAVILFWYDDIYHIQHHIIVIVSGFAWDGNNNIRLYHYIYEGYGRHKDAKEYGRCNNFNIKENINHNDQDTIFLQCFIHINYNDNKNIIESEKEKDWNNDHHNIQKGSITNGYQRQCKNQAENNAKEWYHHVMTKKLKKIF